MGWRNSEDSSKSYFSVMWVPEEADPCRSIFFLEISDCWGSVGLIGGGGCDLLLGSGRDPSKEIYYLLMWNYFSFDLVSVVFSEAVLSFFGKPQQENWIQTNWASSKPKQRAKAFMSLQQYHLQTITIISLVRNLS